ncbi:MAG: exosortase F system-associated protein [Weeksellaceae bacterium]
MNKWLRYGMAGVLIFGLILVRRFEEILFYDPFLQYFKGDFMRGNFPEYDTPKIALNIFFRYALNSVLTLGIIGVLFADWRKVRFTAIILTIIFLVLLPIYLYMAHIQFSIGENIGFYIRRFLIQPILLLLLIPAFYYLDFQKKQTED